MLGSSQPLATKNVLNRFAKHKFFAINSYQLSELYFRLYYLCLSIYLLFCVYMHTCLCMYISAFLSMCKSA